MSRPSLVDQREKPSSSSFRLSDIESLSDRDVKLRERNHQEEGSTDTESNQPQDDTQILAQEESKQLRQVKYCMITLITLVGLGSALATYYIASNIIDKYYAETRQYLAQSTIEGFLEATKALIWTTYPVSVSYTSYFEEYSGREWPFVTLPNYSLRTIGALATSKAKALSFAPIIKTDTLRRQWEIYAANSQYLLKDDEQSVVSAEIEHRRMTMTTESIFGRDFSSSFSSTTPNTTPRMANSNRTIEDGIYRIVSGSVCMDDPGPGPYAPIWQTTPITSSNIVHTMYNQASHWNRRKAILDMLQSKRATFTDVLFNEQDHDIDKPIIPTTLLFFPVVSTFRNNEIDGSITVEFDWQDIFSNLLPDHAHPFVVVLENTCQQIFTFQVEGHVAHFMGEGDFHNTKYDDKAIRTEFEEFEKITRMGSIRPNASMASSGCIYRIHTYPSDELDREYSANQAVQYAFIVASIFLFAIICLVIYDCRVEKRHYRIMQSASRTSAIVHQLFPKQVRQRMLKHQEDTQTAQRTLSFDMDSAAARARLARRNSLLAAVPIVTPKLRLKKFLSSHTTGDCNGISGRGSAMENDMEGEPIADLFPHTTIMFADIAGFTAWSSEREPSQVFRLLESLYKSFDGVAKKLGVFKVETIGDCYVAVTGLPDPKNDHAVIMARFAFECLYHMHELTKSLENALGPGTTDLALRVGLHSGPVTAGVLRGEKSRFQLFGDTMNTAARMESTGQKNRIQVSQDTADLIISAGKEHWLSQREGLVTAKGKGEMQTFWLSPRRGSTLREQSLRIIPSQVHPQEMKPERLVRLSSTKSIKTFQSTRWAELSLDESNHQSTPPQVSTKKARLVNWNVDLLLTLLTKVVARRKTCESKWTLRNELPPTTEGALMILEEVAEIINLPGFDPKATQSDNTATVVCERVKRQLRDYITRIAATYHDVPFHNFEHASHVTMSAHKLLKRIIYPDDLDYLKEGEKQNERARAVALDLHFSTYGISSDPLTQFTIVFSALIHDVDHTGLPNAQLVKEEARVAQRYQNKSVAEQNSVAIALDMLAEPKYEELRLCIYGNADEKKRFRQLVVNAVMATDIMDKGQQSIRKIRWDRAFNEPLGLVVGLPTEGLDINRKATSVIEHIIQASDVAHTMQHWRIYRKWNERLFHEMTDAFQAGRADKDPADGWFEGEIWFFDNYIIPLAKKLKECGVFGVSSDEYLTYALENRKEWEVKGREVVRDMIERSKRGARNNNSSISIFDDLHKSTFDPRFNDSFVSIPSPSNTLV